MLLNNKVAFITGGSRGIGAAIVKSFIKYGAQKVIFTYNTKAQAAKDLFDEIVNSYGENYKERIEFFQLDLTSEDLEKVLEKHLGQTKIDILVNNAGIVDDGLFLTKNFQKWMKVIEVNFLGAVRVIRYILPKMIYHKEGCIVNVLSVGGLIGISGQTNYTAAKAALLAFSRSLSKEVIKFNIRINNVAPGYVDTDMVNQYPDNIKAEFLRNVPMRRFASPEEIANVVTFLCSPLASYVSGEVIIVDGGMLA